MNAPYKKLTIDQALVTFQVIAMLCLLLLSLSALL